MGLCTVPGVAYISEMTTLKLSPMLNSCSSLFISLGTLFIYFLGFIIEVCLNIYNRVSKNDSKKDSKKNCTTYK